MATLENINQLRLLTGITSAGVGHLRPFMLQKTRVGNDRSQSTTDVPRRRNRNEKLHKAGARSSVTLAAQTLIEGPLFQKSNWRYRPTADRTLKRALQPARLPEAVLDRRPIQPTTRIRVGRV